MRLFSLMELLGNEVLVHDGRIGVLDDLYFDRDCGKVRYLVVAKGRAARQPPVVVSTGLTRRLSTQGVLIALSRAQLECGAGAWPLEGARAWLDHARLCSAEQVLGFSVQAEDGSAGLLLDLLIDDEHWEIDYALVECDDRLSPRPVLVPLHWVAAIDLGRRSLRLRCTREELENCPGP